ncbi:hypothetical protein K1T71_003533 [Dendrolimus kikuchii]|uniref:Uncharacterized protein n=1 Tax=Dendrolimus kikuchii TaxID=765133 RepID=A0ACC1DBY7_9NEOP|nr:hypothetical protein K1T71_003533 [Dendrolimus kikuchii]
MIGLVIVALLGLLTTAYGNVIVYTQTIPHSVVDEYLDMPASFGGDLPVEGLRGLLVAGEPSDGCAPLTKPPLVENFTGHWIVLIARYNCNFEVKVRNAQDAGYNCAIVHNVNASDLETMSAKDPTGIIIPSVFVSSTAGSDLLDNFLYTDGYYIMVNGDLPFNINTNLLLPFAVVVVLCLLIILIFMIVKCIKDRRRARRHRLPNRALMKIPTCKFSKGDPYETCAICLDDYQEGDKLRVLPCAHAYHSVCIDPWLTQNKRVCPVCKRRVFTAGERRRPDSDSDSDDTEPLLPEGGERDHAAATQGGTFEQQSENPFSRAARFMARLRARARDESSAEATPAPQGNVEVNDNEENNSEDTRRLIQPVVSAVSERRTRRARRTRSAGHNPSSRRRGDPMVHSDSHSINTEARGQIGVAALPVVQQSTSTPHHVDL